MKLRFKIKYTSHTSLYTHDINSILSCVELNKYIKNKNRTACNDVESNDYEIISHNKTPNIINVC